MSMDYIRRAYGVPAKRGGRVSFTAGEKAVQGTIVAARGHYLRVRWDESGLTHSMHPTWMLVYLKTPNVEFSGVPAGHSSNHPAGGTSAGTQG